MSAGFIDSAQLVNEDFSDCGYIHLSNGGVMRFEIMDDPEIMLSGYEDPIQDEPSWLH